MKIIDHKQGTIEWAMARCGRITASELDALVTPLWKVKDGKGPESYIATKVAERWRGEPMLSGGSWSMEQGSILEHEAIPAISGFDGPEITRPGLILTDDEMFGASPDGMFADGGDGSPAGIEIKCPNPDTHVRYLCNGVCPAEYVAQVHGGMYVTGYARWLFVSYCRGFPMLRVWVYSDEKAQAAIHRAVRNANDAIDSLYQRLVRMNGGPPARQERVLDKGTWNADLITV